MRPAVVDRWGLLIGVAVGIPATVAAGAVMATARTFFDTTNAALVLVIVVVAVAALGGRTAGVVTALSAVLSFDFFHTRPYLSLSIDSRDDIETTVLLLAVGLIVGTIATAGRSARRREGAARTEIRRIHRVAEAAAAGDEPAAVVAVAQDELRELLTLRECRFEALPYRDPAALPRLGRNGSPRPAPPRALRRARRRSHRVRAPRGRCRAAGAGPGPADRSLRARALTRRGRALEDRLAAVAIADQVAAVWTPTPHVADREHPR